MQKIIIIGNAIAADIIYGYLLSDDRYEVVGFAVDKEFITNEHKFGLEVHDLEEINIKFSVSDYNLVLGVGYNNVNRNRALLFDKVKELGYTVETYIHPTAIVHSNTKIGEGSMVLSNSVVEPFAEIGENSFIWSNCTIAHHSKIESHIWVASNSILSGEAIIRNYTFIGVQCTIVNKVTVEEQNIIGGGCLITKSTKFNEVYLSRNAEKHRFDAENYSKFYL